MPLTAGLDEVFVWEARGVVFGLIGVVLLPLLARSADSTAERELPAATT